VTAAHVFGAEHPSFDELLAWNKALSPDEIALIESEQAAAADKARRAALRTHWLDCCHRLSDIGERFASRTFATFSVPPGDGKALQIATDAVEMPAVWFYGAMGTGKSHLAGGIVNATVASGTPAIFSSASAWLERLKAAYDEKGNVRSGQRDIIQWLAISPVVVLDDIDKPRFTDWVADRYYTMINARYEKNRPLIITSNLTPADLANKWADANPTDRVRAFAIVDRMREMCGMNIVRVEGESYRGRAV
jgi:DNA replication protein DnaC